MALKPENQNPTEKELMIKLDHLNKQSMTDIHGLGILLKDTYRQLTDKQIHQALVKWYKARKQQATTSK